MSPHHVNQLATDSIPREAAAGTLAASTSIDEIVATLGDAGITGDRIYFLHGTEGASLIEQSGNFLSRLFETELRSEAISSLQAGKTLVAVWGVERDDADKVRAALSAASVTDLRYFGRWTYT